jgi:hypothetical protein
MMHFSLGRAALALLATAVLCLSQAAVASAAGGSSANAKLCQKDGWQTVFRADGSRFANEGDCVSYAAHGGMPTSQALSDCQSFGGTYATGKAPELWTCNGFTATDESDYGNKVATLLQDCSAGGGNRESFSFEPPFPTAKTSFACSAT